MIRPSAVAVVAALLASGCGSTGEAGPPTLPTLVDGTLTACIAPAPALVERADGGWGGLDVGVLRALAADLELDLALVEVSFDEAVSGIALNADRCDVAAGGIVDDPDLGAVVLRTRAYREVEAQVVTTEPSGSVGAEDVTVTVGVETGSAAAASATTRLPSADLQELPSRADLRRALAEGVVDAALVSTTDRAAIGRALGREVSVLATVPTGEQVVLLLPLDADDRLREALDEALGGLVDRGVVGDLQDRWVRR